MSLSQQTMLELMAFADGELEGADKKRIEELIAKNDEARRIVEAMGDLGDEVHEAYEQPSAVASNDIARLVMNRIEKEAKDSRPLPLPHVSDLSAARANRNKALVALAAAVALAAGVMILMRDHEADDHLATSVHPSNPPPALTVPAPAPLPSAQNVLSPTLAAAGGVDVEHVESPSHEVSVFYLPAVAAAANANASSVVVWIGEDSEEGKKVK